MECCRLKPHLHMYSTVFSDIGIPARCLSLPCPFTVAFFFSLANVLLAVYGPMRSLVISEPLKL